MSILSEKPRHIVGWEVSYCSNCSNDEKTFAERIEESCLRRRVGDPIVFRMFLIGA